MSLKHIQSTPANSNLTFRRNRFWKKFLEIQGKSILVRVSEGCSKHQCLILGDTEYGFSLPVKDTLEIFGMEIDNKLNFSKHISNVCRKINNQFNVMLRFRKLIRRESLFKLYKAYILPHFYNCSSPPWAEHLVPRALPPLGGALSPQGSPPLGRST